jgi:hypothetical protein
LYIGEADTALSGYFSGYLSNIHVNKGSALYNTGFTPSTTTLSPVANTSFLACQSNKFRDNSTNGLTITAAGTPKVQTQNPFQLNSGQSYYFDGTGDYLSTVQNPQFAFGSGDYTIEAWVYRADSGTQRAIVDLRGGANLNVLFYMLSGGQLAVFNSTSTFAQSAGVIPLNQWTHVAVTRSGTSVRLFINGGIDGTATNSDVNVSSGPAYIGRQNGSATNDWLGYITDVRITKGYARYTANIAVPTTAFLAS